MDTNFNPDRYTVFTLKPSELLTKLEHIQALDLVWFAQSNEHGGNQIKLYVFFDEIGKHKWLNGEWRQPKDQAIT